MDGLRNQPAYDTPSIGNTLVLRFLCFNGGGTPKTDQGNHLKKRKTKEQKMTRNLLHERSNSGKERKTGKKKKEEKKRKEKTGRKKKQKGRRKKKKRKKERKKKEKKINKRRRRKR